jgi:hypothetical protein
MDSNFQYANTVRWHRAADLPLPLTVKRRSAGRPPPTARPRSEAQRRSVRPAAAILSTHREMRCHRQGKREIMGLMAVAAKIVSNHPASTPSARLTLPAMVANRDANCRRAWSQLPELG